MMELARGRTTDTRNFVDRKKDAKKGRIRMVGGGGRGRKSVVFV